MSKEAQSFLTVLLSLVVPILVLLLVSLITGGALSMSIGRTGALLGVAGGSRAGGEGR